jgi:hypothetical protein
MKTVTVRTLVSSTTYKGLVEEAEKKLSLFFEFDIEDLNNKISYEMMIHESSDTGDTLSIFTADVLAKLRNQNG